jgi:hypothetical protein
MIAIWAGIGSLAAMVGAIGLWLGVLPGSGAFDHEIRPFVQNAAPFLAGEEPEQHCVAQVDSITRPGASEPEPLLPRQPVMCYDTFDEAIQSIELDPDDYRPAR